MSIINELESKVSKWKGSKLSDSMILDLFANQCALVWYHTTGYKGKKVLELREMLIGSSELLKQGAEKEAFGLMNTIEPNSFHPRHFSKSSVEHSPLIAFVSAGKWRMRCKNEQDLTEMRVAKDKAIASLENKFFKVSYEASYQFQVYAVRKDLKALRLFVDGSRSSVKYHPDPSYKDEVENFVGIWDTHLKKKGF